MTILLPLSPDIAALHVGKPVPLFGKNCRRPDQEYFLVSRTFWKGKQRYRLKVSVGVYK